MPSDRIPRHWRVLSVITLGTLLTGVNASTLNVALPVVIRHFRASAFAANWVLLSFLLANTVLLVLAGRLADVFGRPRTYLAGHAVFTVSSLLLGLAPSIEALIALRAVQAIGFALILANGAAIIADAFPAESLGQGMGFYISAISVSQVLGPSVGGLLADVAGWRWVFWFNVPFGLAAIAWGGLTFFPRVRAGSPVEKRAGRRREPVDVRGAVLLLGWLGGLLLALSEGGALGWRSPLVLAGALAFAVFAPLFWWAQSRTAYPLVDLRLFRDAPFSLANAAAFFHTLARFGIVLVFALYFQGVWGVGASVAGLAVLPVPVAMMIASPLAGFLARRVGPRAVAVTGPVLTVAGLLVLLVSLGPDRPYAVIALGLGLMGAGSGVFLTANTTAIMSRVPEAALGVTNGMRLTLQNVGNTLGIALSLSLIAGALPRHLRPSVFAGQAPAGVESAMATGYHRAILAMIAMALVSLVAAVSGLLAEKATQTAASDDSQNLRKR